MTDPEDPTRAAGARLTQAVAVTATAAELLASAAAHRAADRADHADRHAAGLRATARASTAAEQLVSFDACGDPMPSPTAVLAPRPGTGAGRPQAEPGQVIDGQVVGRAYPAPQTAQTVQTAASAATGAAATTAPAGRALAASPEAARAAVTVVRPPAPRR